MNDYNIYSEMKQNKPQDIVETQSEKEEGRL